MQTGKVKKTGQVVAAEAQAKNADPVPACQRYRPPAPLPVGGPPGHEHEQGQGKQHAVHDERDGIHLIAVGQLDDDGLATEGNGTHGRQQHPDGSVVGGYLGLDGRGLRHF